jgi:hypothetical protein
MADPDPAEGFGRYLSELEQGHLHKFAEWSTTSMVAGHPGVYTIWRGDEFIYVGISYRAAAETSNPQARGLFGRLGSHASGRRSGNQFCIYICDRFVIPTLTPEQLAEVGAGELSLDALTRDYIRSRLAFRYVFTASGQEAREVEGAVRRAGLPGAGPPFLNPA